MAIRDLKWTDYSRLALVLSDVAEGQNGPSLSDLFSSIGDKLPSSDEPRRSPFVGFSNPPSPKVADVQPEWDRLRKRVRDAVVKRYGQKYADELWGRLTQK